MDYFYQFAKLVIGKNSGKICLFFASFGYPLIYHSDAYLSIQVCLVIIAV